MPFGALGHGGLQEQMSCQMTFLQPKICEPEILAVANEHTSGM